MNIITILKKLKSQGSRIELDNPLYGVASIDDIDFITSSFDGSEYIKIKYDGVNLYFDSNGCYVLNYDCIKAGRVFVTDCCMLLPVINGTRKNWEDINVPEVHKYIICNNSVYYILTDNYGNLELVDSIGDIHDYNPNTFKDYEVIDPEKDTVYIHYFIKSIMNNTDASKVFKDILSKFTVVTYVPTFDKDTFAMMIDLISAEDEIDPNNIVNYVLRIPVEKLHNYKFDFKDLKKFDEDPITRK